MFDSMNIYQSLNTNNEKVIKNPKILTFVPDHFKTKKLCKHAVKKLPFIIGYIPDKYKYQQICLSFPFYYL